MPAPSHARPRLDLSTGRFDLVIFDLDGVVTDTASLHAEAWKEVFDAFLARHAGPNFRPFDAKAEYLNYVDGKPRYDGVRSFLGARSIRLPEGGDDDPPGADTVRSIGDAKDARFLRLLAERGPGLYQSSLDVIDALRRAGFKLAVVTASRNARAVLEAAGLTQRFDTIVDGNERARLDLAGKPSPATFLEAARRLDVEPERAVVLEDAVAGVEAGRRGGFGLVIGVDRAGHGADLRRAGADVVIRDLAELGVRGRGASGGAK